MDRGISSNDPGDGRLLAAIGPSLGIEGALPARREIDNDAVAVTQHGAIHAHILRTAIVVAGYDDGRYVRCFVLSGRPGDDGQISQACSFTEKLGFLADAAAYGPRLYRSAQRGDHRIVNGVDLTLQGKRYAAR